MELLPPLFVQIALTFLLLIAMGVARVRAIASRQVRVRDIALRQPNWPEGATRISNAYHNQLETPLLFYLLLVLIILTKTEPTSFLYLAWGFVALRVIHAIIHVASSRARLRFYVFLATSILLGAMWVIFAMSLYS